MNKSVCEDMRRRLSAYLDGELEIESQRAVVNHLTRCGDCARELESLRLLVNTLGTLPDVKPRHDIAGAALDVIESESRFNWKRLFSPRFALAGGGVLAALLVGLVLLKDAGLFKSPPLQVASVTGERSLHEARATDEFGHEGDGVRELDLKPGAGTEGREGTASTLGEDGSELRNSIGETALHEGLPIDAVGDRISGTNEPAPVINGVLQSEEADSAASAAPSDMKKGNEGRFFEGGNDAGVALQGGDGVAKGMASSLEAFDFVPEKSDGGKDNLRTEMAAASVAGTLAPASAEDLTAGEDQARDEDNAGKVAFMTINGNASIPAAAPMSGSAAGTGGTSAAALPPEGSSEESLGQADREGEGSPASQDTLAPGLIGRTSGEIQAVDGEKHVVMADSLLEPGDQVQTYPPTELATNVKRPSSEENVESAATLAKPSTTGARPGALIDEYAPSDGQLSATPAMESGKRRDLVVEGEDERVAKAAVAFEEREPVRRKRKQERYDLIIPSADPVRSASALLELLAREGWSNARLVKAATAEHDAAGIALNMPGGLPAHLRPLVMDITVPATASLEVLQLVRGDQESLHGESMDFFHTRGEELGALRGLPPGRNWRDEGGDDDGRFQEKDNDGDGLVAEETGETRLRSKKEDVNGFGEDAPQPVPAADRPKETSESVLTVGSNVDIAGATPELARRGGSLYTGGAYKAVTLRILIQPVRPKAGRPAAAPLMEIDTH